MSSFWVIPAVPFETLLEVPSVGSHQFFQDEYSGILRGVSHANAWRIPPNNFFVYFYQISEVILSEIPSKFYYEIPLEFTHFTAPISFWIWISVGLGILKDKDNLKTRRAFWCSS